MPYDFPIESLGFGSLAFLTAFIAGFALSLAGLRAAKVRFEGLLGGYSGDLGKSVERARVLDDVGPAGVIVGRLVFGAHAALSVFALVVALGGALALGILTQRPAIAAVIIGLLLGLPFVLSNLVDVVSRQRVRMIERALPDAATLIGSSLGAGLPFQAALGGVAQHMKGPLATEARIASNEIAAGRTVSEAMASMVRRTPSNYLAIFAAAVSVHVERGGNLPVAMRDLGGALTRIVLAEAEVQAKTAGSRREALWATLVPFLIMPVAFLIMPDMVGTLFTTLAGFVVLAIAGGVWVYCVRKLGEVSRREV